MVTDRAPVGEADVVDAVGVLLDDHVAGRSQVPAVAADQVAAEAAVGRLWAPLIGTAEAPAPDAKTALQEYAQSRKWGLPEYREVGRSGADHAPSFMVEVSVKGLKPEQGAGPSLKKAQQAAAEALLKREAVWPAEHDHV